MFLVSYKASSDLYPRPSLREGSDFMHSMYLHFFLSLLSDSFQSRRLFSPKEISIIIIIIIIIIISSNSSSSSSSSLYVDALNETLHYRHSYWSVAGGGGACCCSRCPVNW